MSSLTLMEWVERNWTVWLIQALWRVGILQSVWRTEFSCDSESKGASIRVMSTCPTSLTMITHAYKHTICEPLFKIILSPAQHAECGLLIKSCHDFLLINWKYYIETLAGQPQTWRKVRRVLKEGITKETTAHLHLIRHPLMSTFVTAYSLKESVVNNPPAENLLVYRRKFLLGQQLSWNTAVKYAQINFMSR